MANLHGGDLVCKDGCLGLGTCVKDRGLRLTRWNIIEADEETLQSDIPHIFTGGDIWSGPALLIDAVGTGRRAARSINLFLNGRDLSFPEGTYKKPNQDSRIR